MNRAYSLAYLTAAPLSPPDAVSLAARLGYAHVGLRLRPAMEGGDFSALADDRALLKATLDSVRDTGVTVFDIEIVRLGPGFAVESVRSFLETGAALGARAVLVAGDDPVEARLTQSFAAFCQAAGEAGLTADLEFMPWTAVPDCRTAHRIVAAAGQPNGHVLVDSLHAARSATRLDDLRALPRSMIGYVQICDAPAEVPATMEGLIHTARRARLLPGEGGIDLAAMFAALPQDAPVSIELPNDVEKAALGVEEWARRGLAAARRICEGSPE